LIEIRPGNSGLYLLEQTLDRPVQKHNIALTLPDARPLQMKHLRHLVNINGAFQVHQVLESVQCAERGRPASAVQIVHNNRRRIKACTSRGRHNERSHGLCPEQPHLVHKAKRGPDRRAAVRPVAGADHAAVELIVLVQRLEQEVPDDKIYVEVLVLEDDCEAVAVEDLVDGLPVGLTVLCLVRIEKHDLVGVVVPDHLPEG